VLRLGQIGQPFTEEREDAGVEAGDRRGRQRIAGPDQALVALPAVGRDLDEAAALAVQAADAMRCLDHVRIDIKTDARGALRVMEVNGIPGLKPLKSWAPQIYTLYFRSPEGEMADYRNLIRTIIEAGGSRYGIS